MNTHIINYNIKNNYWCLHINDFNLIYNKKLNLYNASRVCDIYEKNIHIWLEENYDYTIKYLKIKEINDHVSIINNNKESSLNGLYVSEHILLGISIWISEECYYKCINIILHNHDIFKLDNDILNYKDIYTNLNKNIIIDRNNIKDKIDKIINNIQNNETITRKYILNNIQSDLNKIILWVEIKNILKWKNSKLPIKYNYKNIYLKY
ncbi:putative RING finger host range protein [Betaentomopoxvirus amoorei]|uniref:AMV132 n=1 Tax=Amsacta moorei entomopoxvirus TaxID=28321 RepID=Q9EMR7_AMEPV|nr:putative RING finger host range protein [Amsacta moorei entomopoxvirus]AAG02838.1 AMV132 [Amsacta moorei entomopoxvirus]